MCAVNDAIRASLSSQITELQNEYNTENAKLEDINNAKTEVNQLIDNAQCAINNLSNCNFGGDEIITCVRTSQKGYFNKIDYYDEYILKCKNAMELINEEKNKLISERNALPINCGACPECCPPVIPEEKGVMRYGK